MVVSKLKGAVVSRGTASEEKTYSTPVPDKFLKIVFMFSEHK